MAKRYRMRRTRKRGGAGTFDLIATKNFFGATEYVCPLCKSPVSLDDGCTVEHTMFCANKGKIVNRPQCLTQNNIMLASNVAGLALSGMGAKRKTRSRKLKRKSNHKIN